MLYVGLMVGSLIFAFQAIRETRLMIAAIWLACTSALLAVFLYALGGREIAIIELSVGAGLVTVLLAFAFSLVGESIRESLNLIPRRLIWALLLHITIFLAWLVFPLTESAVPVASTTFSNTLWEGRSIDVLAQIGLIFVGVLGVLGLLGDSRSARGQTNAVNRQRDSRTYKVEREANGSPEALFEIEEKTA